MFRPPTLFSFMFPMLPTCHSMWHGALHPNFSGATSTTNLIAHHDNNVISRLRFYRTLTCPPADKLGYETKAKKLFALAGSKGKDEHIESSGTGETHSHYVEEEPEILKGSHASTISQRGSLVRERKETFSLKKQEEKDFQRLQMELKAPVLNQKELLESLEYHILQKGKAFDETGYFYSNKALVKALEWFSISLANQDQKKSAYRILQKISTSSMTEKESKNYAKEAVYRAITLYKTLQVDFYLKNVKESFEIIYFKKSSELKKTNEYNALRRWLGSQREGAILKFFDQLLNEYFKSVGVISSTERILGISQQWNQVVDYIYVSCATSRTEMYDLFDMLLQLSRYQPPLLEHGHALIQRLEDKIRAEAAIISLKKKYQELNLRYFDFIRLKFQRRLHGRPTESGLGATYLPFGKSVFLQKVCSKLLASENTEAEKSEFICQVVQPKLLDLALEYQVWKEDLGDILEVLCRTAKRFLQGSVLSDENQVILNAIFQVISHLKNSPDVAEENRLFAEEASRYLRSLEKRRKLQDKLGPQKYFELLKRERIIFDQNKNLLKDALESDLPSILKFFAAFQGGTWKNAAEILLDVNTNNDSKYKILDMLKAHIFHASQPPETIAGEYQRESPNTPLIVLIWCLAVNDSHSKSINPTFSKQQQRSSWKIYSSVANYLEDIGEHHGLSFAEANLAQLACQYIKRSILTNSKLEIDNIANLGSYSHAQIPEDILFKKDKDIKLGISSAQKEV
ncbi:hypothetical protein O181_042628 [Austropuccinia psidii MF-1]|uniref:Uncharacterized protein n=1 Tax=Austropuccinia psidii MF-1 TaxID=1389203 RepID=A0A9Q3HEY4_9BASI|nr:hypothetical protein [Austropuccinia psidii MF-1]